MACVPPVSGQLVYILMVMGAASWALIGCATNAIRSRTENKTSHFRNDIHKLLIKHPHLLTNRTCPAGQYRASRSIVTSNIKARKRPIQGHPGQPAVPSPNNRGNRRRQVFSPLRAIFVGEGT